MPKARVLDAFVVWALSVVLSAIFLLAGVPKLLGTETIGLQAAAMHNFPTWIRLIAGALETIGAIGLLIPPFATAAAVLLALIMVPATVTQYISGEPGVLVPPLLLLLLLFVAWRRNAATVSATVSTRYHGFTESPHPLLWDGVIAGLIGASTIAVWFFIIDSVAGRPLATPAILGQGLLSLFNAVPASNETFTFVLVYTVFHFAAFIFVGLVAALVVLAARREPSILFGFIILFVMTEVGIYGLVALMEVGTRLGAHAWLQIMASNLIAILAMGAFFYRTHRELGEQFRHSLDWEPAPPAEQPPPLLPHARRPGRS